MQATEKQLSLDGELWADLCPIHAQRLNAALDDMTSQGGEFYTKRFLSVYVLAQGGFRVAAVRTLNAAWGSKRKFAEALAKLRDAAGADSNETKED